jgi:uncharacterized protein YyaL (SSP411 family)
MINNQNKPTFTNRLVHEKSPYLLQHAHNPVHWYPWGEEAFGKAREENKPIFLSIGYSTCHWCHVMERESFEDQEVADLLNAHFISVKVDREERPDIDQIYMSVCQALTGHGGWPLSILMTADQKPFFAGTYFPKTNRYGKPGLIEILQKVKTLWQEQQHQLLDTSEKLTTALHEMQQNPAAPVVLSLTTFEAAYEQLEESYDDLYGGFGKEPKFPTPHHYLYLLREWYRTGNEEALDMVCHSLTSMYRGGIYDHLGYGFSRYSVDAKWLVPHFEKMLYDNALLTYTYLETFQATGENFYQAVAESIIEYVQRELRSPEGAFYSAEDAESEGEEGKFYVWTAAEIEQVIGEKEGKWFCDFYGVSPEGNFEGKNVLHVLQAPSLSSFANKTGLDKENIQPLLEEARHQLFAFREKRAKPHLDDKVLTAWNAMMIAAMAKAAAVLQKEQYARLAGQAVHFIEERLVRNGRLYSRYRDGETRYKGYLDDYAYYVWALHELYFATADPHYLDRAMYYLNEVIDLFWDAEQGGFYFTGDEAEKLFIRPKEYDDSAVPSGNSVMALNLIRHIRFTGATKYEQYLNRLIQSYSADVSHQPEGYTFFLCALQMAFGQAQEIVLVQGQNTDVYEEIKALLQETYLPNAILLYKGEGVDIDSLAPIHTDKQAIGGQTTLYLCRNFSCQAPLFSVDEIQQALKVFRS